MDNELRERLKELIDMWEEVSQHQNFDRGLLREAAVRRDCVNDLKEVMGGNYSCIEKLDS